MKKSILFLIFVTGTLAMHAADYDYLTFETTDGDRVSVSVSSLTIGISGTTLTAGSQSFTLSNLSKMYFSSSDETTAIRTLSASEWNEATDIYDLNGRKVGKDQLKRGVYVVKTKNGTFKLTAK
ncbi:MAG: hypothetical protein IJR87_06445 [Bacteroidaceae bacterium]|nr:hypothetical protein [Bacteroidaceae bacterium]